MKKFTLYKVKPELRVSGTPPESCSIQTKTGISVTPNEPLPDNKLIITLDNKISR